jgi:hypothetical protein
MLSNYLCFRLISVNFYSVVISGNVNFLIIYAERIQDGRGMISMFP